MTRLAQSITRQYPRKFIWYMECDVCHKTRSSPEWSASDLPLERFIANGWRCQTDGPMDTCPDCLKTETTP